MKTTQSKRKLITALLAALMVLCLALGISLLMPKTQSAYAATYVNADGQTATVDADVVTSITESSTTWNAGWYIVDSNVNISSRITVNGEVNLILGDGFTLNANAGITVSEIDILTIYAQTAGTGTLNATGSDGTSNVGASAGIGGIGGEYAHIGYDCGKVIIRGGIINAIGGSSRSTGAGAGIGGGGAGHYYEQSGDIEVMGSLSGGDCISVIITGGTVRACGGSSILNMGGDGIGGGGAKTGFNGVYEPGDKGTLNLFSTAGGSAVIYAVGGGGESSSANGVAIGSTDDGEPWNSDSWSGIIFQGNSGQVYGDQTLSGNFTVESGQTLTVPSGTTLTVPAGTILTNNGAITNNGTINVYGTFAGNSVSGNEVNIILHTCESIENGVTDAVALSSAGGELSGGNYYLAGDIDLTNNITVNGTATLCLNGHTITGTGSGSVITVNSDAHFTLCDCSKEQTGLVTGGSGIIINDVYGGGVYVYGTFIMNGGTIAGNNATIRELGSTSELFSANGGGVYIASGAIFIMNGGEISDNTAEADVPAYESFAYGGGVYVDGTFTMNDGTITDNDMFGQLMIPMAVACM